MRDTNKRWKRLAKTLILVLALNGFANAQSNSASTQKPKVAPAPTLSDDLAKSLEIALIELQHLRKVKELSAEQISALEAKIAALEDLVRIERQRAEAYKAANAERATANALDDKRIALFEKMIEDFKAELVRVRGERDRARGRNKIIAAVCLLLGFGLGWAAQK
jgi:TolA-binding protein